MLLDFYSYRPERSDSMIAWLRVVHSPVVRCCLSSRVWFRPGSKFRGQAGILCSLSPICILGIRMPNTPLFLGLVELPTVSAKHLKAIWFPNIVHLIIQTECSFNCSRKSVFHLCSPLFPGWSFSNITLSWLSHPKNLQWLSFAYKIKPRFLRRISRPLMIQLLHLSPSSFVFLSPPHLPPCHQ